MVLELIVSSIIVQFLLRQDHVVTGLITTTSPFSQTYRILPRTCLNMVSTIPLQTDAENFVPLPPDKDHDAAFLKILQETDTLQSALPYLVERGDGMTGGGGLPMPNRPKDNTQLTEVESSKETAPEGLRRPKASMKIA